MLNKFLPQVSPSRLDILLHFLSIRFNFTGEEVVPFRPFGLGLLALSLQTNTCSRRESRSLKFGERMSATNCAVITTPRLLRPAVNGVWIIHIGQQASMTAANSPEIPYHPWVYTRSTI